MFIFIFCFLFIEETKVLTVVEKKANQLPEKQWDGKTIAYSKSNE